MLKEALRAFKHASRDRRESDGLARLYARIPELATLRATAHASRNLLAAAYRTYATTVSTPVWAISLETAGLLHALCFLLRPAAILDLGSGFSSFTFRSYARSAPHPCTVHSVDEDSHWLERTREFLGRHQLPTDGLFLWSEFRHRTPLNYDLILHDMGRMALRLKSLDTVFSCRAPAGLIVLDDMHRPEYASDALAKCRARSLEVLSLRKLTIDQFGRYACLALISAGR